MIVGSYDLLPDINMDGYLRYLVGGLLTTPGDGLKERLKYISQ